MVISSRKLDGLERAAGEIRAQVTGEVLVVGGGAMIKGGIQVIKGGIHTADETRAAATSAPAIRSTSSSTVTYGGIT